jgi:hypothetical protein
LPRGSPHCNKVSVQSFRNAAKAGSRRARG